MRRAAGSDAPSLTMLAHAAKRHWRYDEKLIELWRPDLTITSDDIASDVVWCAELDGSIAGFYSASHDAHEAKVWEVEHLWVRPDLIGTGVGRILFGHMIGELRAREAKSLRIVSDPNAAGFYERMGARRIGDVASSPPGRSLPLFVFDGFDYSI